LLLSVANKIAPANEARTTRRFALRLPVRYRLHGEQTWRSGETENVSGSGVLFRGQAAAKAGTALELSLALPAVLESQETAEVICRGVVVRSARALDGNLPGLAMRILHSRVTRG